MDQRMVRRKQLTRPLNFKVSNIEWGHVISSGHAVDISSHGLGMTSNYPLEEGMVLLISLPVDDFGVTLPLFTEVAWVSPVTEGYRAGLRFLS